MSHVYGKFILLTPTNNNWSCVSMNIMCLPMTIRMVLIVVRYTHVHSNHYCCHTIIIVCTVCLYIAGASLLRAGTEPGKLGLARKKLLNFLENSKFYVPEKLISDFQQDSELCGMCVCTCS